VGEHEVSAGSARAECEAKWLAAEPGNESMLKLMLALGAMALVAVAADRTLTNEKLRLGTFVVLGFFAVKIVFAYTQQRREELQEQGK